MEQLLYKERIKDSDWFRTKQNVIPRFRPKDLPPLLFTKAHLYSPHLSKGSSGRKQKSEQSQKKLLALFILFGL